jgi:curli production assembly/transport component CsgG
MLYAWSKSACAVALMVGLSGCIAGGLGDPLAEQASMVPDTKTGVVLANLPAPAQALDVSVYSFPDLTGQNKDNDNFAEFSRAVTQGGAAILTDVLTKAGGGEWFNVVERNELTALLQERQIIQNTRVALYGKQAESLPALRFAGVMLQGGIIGYDTNETSGGVGANWLGIGGNIQYRRDVVTVALRAVSVQTGRVMASVTTTETVYSVLVQGSAFRYQAVNELLQAEAGITKNSPVTLAVREGVQLAVYALIFEGVKHDLWKFKDTVAGAAFMHDLDLTGKAVNEAPIPVAPGSVSPSPTASLATPQTVAAVAAPPIVAQPSVSAAVAVTPSPSVPTQLRSDVSPSPIPTPPERPADLPQTTLANSEVSFDR